MFLLDNKFNRWKTLEMCMLLVANIGSSVYLTSLFFSGFK